MHIEALTAGETIERHPLSARQGWPLLASIAIQIPLALFLAHAYDAPIFMATGYLAGSGANPYLPRDLTGVFASPLFHGLTSIGYPPPWAIVLGILYRLTFARTANLFLYNLAIKLPAVAASIALAWLVRVLSRRAGATEADSKSAMLFMLFNPLILITTAAWGQFDTVVALLALLSLLLLSRGMPGLSAISLSLAVSLKPIALPLIPLAVMAARFVPAAVAPGRAWAAFPTGRTPFARAASYTAALALGLLLFSAAPFFIFRWDPWIILRNWNTHFIAAGGLSWLSFFELIGNSYTLPASLAFLGLLWLPAVMVGALFLKPMSAGFEELLDKGLRLILLFFITRSWLSEPNVNLLLPMAVILTASGRLSKRHLLALWALPLAFALLNTSLAQLFPLIWEKPMDLVRILDSRARTARIIARCAVVLPWILVGWRIVLRGERATAKEKGAAEEDASHSQPAGPHRDPRLSLILPTYNESKNLEEVISRIELALGGLPGCTFELIIVDDDSPDGTGRLAEQAATLYPNIRILRRGRRKGLASAIRDGMEAARGEFVAVMDADLQHPPESLPDLLHRLDEGADVAVMSRYAAGGRRADRGLLRRLASWSAIALTHFLLPPTRGVRDPVSGFFMARACVLKELALEPLGFKVLPQIIIRCPRSRLCEVPYTFRSRNRGKSKMQAQESLRYVRLLLSLRKECAP